MTTIRECNNIKSVGQLVVDLDLLSYLATEGRQRKEILEAIASLVEGVQRSSSPGLHRELCAAR